MTDRKAVTRAFHGKADFRATNDAEAYLTRRGFSFGPMERGSPRGVMFGDFQIAKWHNLSPAERDACHGLIEGNGRNGPVVVRIWTGHPEAATAFLGPPQEG